MESSIRNAAGEGSEQNSGNKCGGWITFPFISATMVGVTLAAGGWSNNLQVYMIKKFNVEHINSVQISNVVSGCNYMLPVLAAIIADSYLGSFLVIAIASLFSLLGIFLLMITATIDSLRPPPCNPPNTCLSPTKEQYALLYISLAFAVLGVSGTRFTIQAMGANQFQSAKHQSTFFNWLFCALYVSYAISATVVVYIEDNVGFGVGFGICLVANVIGLVAFLLGKRFYRDVRPSGSPSPYTRLACVIVAAFRKRNLLLSGTKEDDYYYGKTDDGMFTVELTPPSKSFKFLNHAALKLEGDIKLDGSRIQKWKLCTVRQVEDLKTLIKLLPLWSAGILLSAPLTTQLGLTILQALKMDRHLGPHFEIPPGSMIVFILLSTVVTVFVYDRFVSPTRRKLTGRSMTPLQRYGAGHVFTVLSMVVSALVEHKRLKKVNSNASLSVIWLVPQLAISGMGEAFHVPGSTEFFYREFPESLKSTSTSMMSLFVGIAFYVSTALIGLIRRATTWLPDDINHGRIDKVFWMLSIIALVNFGYYLVCARTYKYKDSEEEVDEGFSSPGE